MHSLSTDFNDTAQQRRGTKREHEPARFRHRRRASNNLNRGGRAIRLTVEGVGFSSDANRQTPGSHKISFLASRSRACSHATRARASCLPVITKKGNVRGRRTRLFTPSDGYTCTVCHALHASIAGRTTPDQFSLFRVRSAARTFSIGVSSSVEINVGTAEWVINRC